MVVPGRSGGLNVVMEGHMLGLSALHVLSRGVRHMCFAKLMTKAE